MNAKLGVFVLSLGVGGLSGCSTYAVSRYSASVDNVTELRKLAGTKVTVGDFTTKNGNKSSIGCRAVGPIKTPDGEPYAQYIRKALLTELKMAEVYADGAPVTLTGSLDHLDFSSTSGAWQIGVTVSSSNGQSVHIEESYEYSSSFFGETACNQTAQAFMPGVQDLIAKLVRDPAFKALVGASDAAPSKPAASNAAALGAKRKR
jgi:hypothetical protein